MKDINIEDKPYLFSIYSSLKHQVKKLDDAYYNFTRSDYVTGIEEFRRARVSSVNLLKEYIRAEEAKGFSSLSATILKAPPYLLDDYHLRQGVGDEIKSHISFLEGLMNGLKDGTVKPNGTKVEINRKKVLKELYDLNEKQRPYESSIDLGISTNIDYFEMYEILEYLKEKDLVREENFAFVVTLAGRKEVEMINKIDQETPEQRRFRVLKTIYDLAEGSPSEIIMYEILEKETQIDSNKIDGILRYLEQRHLVTTRENWVEITSDGIDQIEKMRRHPESPTEYFPANIFYNTFNAPVAGIQQAGQNNTQNNIQNINPDFTEAINKLLALIESSSLNLVQKIKIKSDVQTIKELAVLDKSPEVIELATSKIEAVKEVISMTADMTSLGMVLIPILQAAFGS